MLQVVRVVVGAFALLGALAAAPPTTAADATGTTLAKPVYPTTRRDTVVDSAFGERIADPYRWLENDVRRDPEVADWVTARMP